MVMGRVLVVVDVVPIAPVVVVVVVVVVSGLVRVELREVFSVIPPPPPPPPVRVSLSTSVPERRKRSVREVKGVVEDELCILLSICRGAGSGNAARRTAVPCAKPMR
jgi:hypothetical protein